MLRNCNIYAAAVSVNLISLSLGHAFTWSSPVLPKLKSGENPFASPITASEEAWIASLVSLGASFGPFVSAYSADRYGRKTTLLVFSTFMLASYLIIAFATTIELFYMARFLLGIGCGCAFATTPIYLGEIAHVGNRGLLGCLISVLLRVGTLSMLAIGPYVSIMHLSFFCTIPLVLFLVFFGIFIPESPYYLIMVNNRRGAELALKTLRQVDSVKEELAAIQKNVEESMKVKKQGFSVIFRSGSVSRGMVVSLGLMFFQQFTGITVFTSYIQSIFQATGSRIPADISSMVIGLMQLITTCLASLLVDRLGRRLLLLISMAGVTVSLLVLGGYFYLKDQSGVDVGFLYALPITALTFYSVVYQLGIGPIAWSILGELFPQSVKATAATISTSVCLFLAFFTTMVFPYFLIWADFAVSFWCFAAISALGVVFVYCLVPETKGKSFEDIQKELSRKSTK